MLKKKRVHETDERGPWGKLVHYEACCCSNRTPEALVRRDGLCWPTGLEVLVRRWLAYPFGTCSEVVYMMEKAAPLMVDGNIKTHRGPDSSISRTLTQGQHCLS